jgi:DNA-binding transcriptional ArsR family regulator
MKRHGKKAGLPIELLARMAERLGALAHPQRLKLLELLETDGDTAVRELVAATGLPQATVSHHLGLMRRGGLLAAERRGREVRYRVADPDAVTILDCIRKRSRGTAHRRSRSSPTGTPDP